MDLDLKRKIEINEWIIATRWFYMVAVFLIGIIGNSLISLFNVQFTFSIIALLLLVFVAINTYFYHALIEIRRTESRSRLLILSYSQILIELIIFTIIMNLVGDRAIVSSFYYLPIISAAIIFGVRGSVITAILSAMLVNMFALYEYFYFIAGNALNKDFFYFILSNEEFRVTTIQLVGVIVTSNFYIVMAIFIGYGIKAVLRKERMLIDKVKNVKKLSAYRENELEQLNKTTKLIVKRDLELTELNAKLDKEIRDAEKVQISMLKAFSDLKKERMKTEEEKDKTVAIISNFIDPIVVFDSDDKIMLINPTARSLFLLNDSDLGVKISKKNNYSMENFRDIIQSDYIVKNHTELDSIDPTEEEITIEFTGQELTYKVITAAVIDNNNKNLGTMKIFYNLTREKMLDKLKSEFISIASHQLRTPLTAIKWAIKMVLDEEEGELNEEQKTMLEKGYKSNERIITLVNDLLNVSRIEEGRFGYSFGKASLEEALKIVSENLEIKIKQKQIKFIVEKHGKIPEVFIDKQKMQLVLQNLLENAIKYTPESGKVGVDLEVDGEFLRVKIKDNGIGIPKIDQIKLFSKFFRATNAVSLQTEGSGLGLFIVRNVIKKHGGDITFNSKEGIGTEFIFTLPVKENKSR
jgi:signal transduction histidine kinase